MKERSFTPYSSVRRKSRAWITACLPAAAFLILPAVASAQALTAGPSSETRQEIEYAEALNKMGLPDYARTVLDRIKDPAAKPIIKVLQMQALASKGDFEAVKKIIAREPNQNSQEAWAMKLTLADNYYAWGRYPEARGIYESLFKAYPKGPSEALNDFYVESSYKYARMLLLLGKNKEAAIAYDNVTKGKVSKAIRRQVITEKAELLVKLAEEEADKAKRKKYFKQIEDICNEILWVQDLWFGKAIVILAHLKMVKGDIDGTMELVEEYGPQLKQIDEILKEDEASTGENLTQLSPMAECRYLLGVMMQDQAEKLLTEGGDQATIIKLLAGAKRPGGKGRAPGALQHMLNVFIRYPGTSWAPDAGARAEKIEEILKAPPFNAKIEKNVTPEQMKKVEEFQFRSARLKFNQNQFKEAAESYVGVLNLFPEGGSSVAALGELARSYVEADNQLYAEMVTRYVAERFCKHPDYTGKAGDQVLRMAMLYMERNQPELRDETYELFFKHFLKHPSAPPTMFRYAEQLFGAKDFARAIEYYGMIRDNYLTSPLRFDALARIVACYSELEQQVPEIKALQAYIKALEGRRRPGQALVSAKYKEAAAYKSLGKKYVVAAFNRFFKLEQLLTGAERPKYEESTIEKKANNEVLQGVLYNKASCYAMMAPPKGKAESYRKLQAIQTLEKLVTDFPKSKFAANALSQVGTLWTILERPKEAGQALEKLQKEYPDSPEASNALFMLGMNLLKMGREQQAVSVFRDMFTSTGKYSDRQVLTAGRELLQAGELRIALDAFNRVLGSSKERGIREPALMGKGEILIREEKFAEAATILEKMFSEYPRSGFTIGASMHLSRAYSELGMAESDTNKRIETFNKAIDAMNRARKFEQDPAGKARLDIELARIIHRKGLAEDLFGEKERATAYKNEAIATYQKLIMFGNTTESGVKNHIETAYHECMPLLLETERWQDVLDDADAYLREFRGGQYAREIRSLRGKAKVKLVSMGQLPQRTVPGAGAGKAPTDEETAVE